MSVPQDFNANASNIPGAKPPHVADANAAHDPSAKALEKRKQEEQKLQLLQAGLPNAWLEKYLPLLQDKERNGSILQLTINNAIEKIQ